MEKDNKKQLEAELKKEEATESNVESKQNTEMQKDNSANNTQEDKKLTPNPEELSKESPIQKEGKEEVDTLSVLESPENQNTTSADNNSMRFKQITLSLAALLFVGGAIFSVMFPSKALELLEPFGVSTSETVAKVNGEKIYYKALENRISQQESSYRSQGADLNDPDIMAQIEAQVLESMITEMIVMQNAIKAGVEVDPSAVSERYDTAASSFSSPEEFKAELANYNLTEESLKENISNQLLIEKYLQQKVNQEATTVSEEEIVNFYEEYSASIEDAESLDVLRHDIEEYLKQQKTDEQIKEIVQKLRDESEVEILI